MIKIKTVLANFGSEKQFKVKKAYFITTAIDLIGEKQSFLENTPFLNEGKVKFLQIRQDVIRQKHEKRCTHEAWYPSPPVRIRKHFGWAPSIPLVTYILNGWSIFQPKDKEEHSNVVFTEI